MFSKIPPAVSALLLQIIALALVLLSFDMLAIKTAPMLIAFACGITAAILSFFTNLARWWMIIQMVFAPAAMATHTLNIPPSVFLAAFLILLLIYWNTYRTQVPLYLSSEKIWLALANYLPPAISAKQFTFIDIGSGLGGVLTFLAGIRPDGIYCGVESAPIPFLWSWLRIRSGGYRQCRVFWGDLWDCNLANYDVVFAYLSPAPMEKLWHKAKSEMRSGTLFISSTFTVPEQTPDERIEVDDLHKSTLLIWRM
jgi:hypothetical protein